MPIHNLGYREWTGTLESLRSRWLVVSGIGIRRAWQSAWLRRIIFFAWMPAAVMGLVIFLYERSAEDGGAPSEMFEGLTQLMLSGGDRGAALRDMALPNRSFDSRDALAANRHQFWSLLLLALFQRTQAFLFIPIVGLIAPPLISQDVRSRGFLLYFSRPLSRVQYIAGKVTTILFYTSIVTLLPGLLLYVIGVLFSPSLSVVMYTWDLPLRIVAASVCVTVPCSFLALMFSSMTTESRFASFAWFSIWIFGYATYAAMLPFSGPDSHVMIQCLSLFHLLRDVEGWILDVKTGITDIETRITVLISITLVSAAVLFRRVSAPMQV